MSKRKREIKLTQENSFIPISPENISDARRSQAVETNSLSPEFLDPPCLQRIEYDEGQLTPLNNDQANLSSIEDLISLLEDEPTEAPLTGESVANNDDSVAEY